MREVFYSIVYYKYNLYRSFDSSSLGRSRVGVVNIQKNHKNDYEKIRS